MQTTLKQNTIYNFSFLFILLSIFLVGSRFTLAENVNWTGGLHPFYNGGANWNPAHDPATTDDVYINPSKSFAYSASDVSVYSIQTGSTDFTDPVLHLMGSLSATFVDIYPYSTLYLDNTNPNIEAPIASVYYTSVIGDFFMNGHYIYYSNQMNVYSFGSLSLNASTSQCFIGLSIAHSGTIFNEAQTYIVGNFSTYDSASIKGYPDSLLMFFDVAFYPPGINTFNDNTTISMQGSTLSFWKYTVLNNNTKIDLYDSPFKIFNSNFFMNDQSYIDVQGVSPILSNGTTLIMNDNSTMNFYNPSFFNLEYQTEDSRNMIIETKFSMNHNSKLHMNHTLLFLQAYLFSLSDNAYIDMKNGSMLLILNNVNQMYDQSRIDVQNSTFSIFTQSSGLIQNDNSSINLFGYQSYMIIGGAHILKDNSYITMVSNAFLIIEGSLIQLNKSNVVSQSSRTSIKGTCIIKDESVAIYTQFSELYNGKIVCDKCTIEQWEGSFRSFGIGVYNNSQISIVGDAHFGEFFVAFNTNITVTGGNLTIYSQSVFNCTNCHIQIVDGFFNYDKDSSVNLFESNLENIGGLIQSIGNVYVYPGSTMSNGGTLNLESGIYKQDQNSQASMVNTGDINSIPNGQKKEITVPLLNNGRMNVVNDDLFVSQLRQNSGSLIIQKGRVQSNESIVNDGGNIHGNGTILSSILNSGKFGTPNTTNNLHVIGNFVQLQNGTIIITINSLKDFTQFNISELFTMGGNIIIRINEDFKPSTESKDNTIPVVNFGDAKGNFSNVGFRTFNPKTGEERDSECGHKLAQSKQSLSVLVSAGCQDSSSKKLSTGAIVGIVIACIIVASLVVVFYHKRQRLSQDFRAKSGVFKLRRVTIRLKD
ncbi:hypothetical protein PPL_04623 [Heterostelium album PN500]|uniref:Transmembrane protein n=1 Tax=Heterostelium pallidum (strain ATCC 26659 / Pp 5 / PN500) TaxID=670386 RepID=D3B832_HETP5|nr:hypothetical protein PPL_04623 [Heterostelium album PN500]EFA82200.1 hypothetical protein PPL_04623 [Heterostelium album PN500]|eukprot:XP_020434317.1 hypothetical protein PPL_04623 [Heterostelium album PN500]